MLSQRPLLLHSPGPAPRNGAAHFQAVSSPSITATETDSFRPTGQSEYPSLVILQCRELTIVVRKVVLLSETWNQQSHLQTLSDALEKGAPFLILFAFYYGVVFASTPAKCNISVILRDRGNG